jgi:cytochrome c biogenesis protein CcdA/glutaredoxin
MKRKKDLQVQKKGDTAPDTDNAPGTRNRTTVILLVVAVLGCAILLGAYALNLFPATPGPDISSGNLTVYFFYGTECPHCHDVLPFVESLRDKYPDVEFRILETWHDDTNRALLNLLSHKAGRGKEQATAVPQIIIGNTSLLGEDEIQAGLENAILAKKGNLTGSAELGAVPVSTTAAAENATIAATYFYGNGCSHCDAVKPVIAEIRAEYPELRLEEREINDNRTNLALFLAMPIPEGSGDDRAIPAIFIGDRALLGEAAVRDHLGEAVYEEQQRLAKAAPAGTVAATPSAPAGSPAGPGGINAVFFYSDVCPHCEKVKPVVDEISARYSGLNLSRLEVSHDAKNRELFNEMCSWSGISNPGVPTIFIGNDCLVGEAQITDRFEESILAQQQRIAAGVTTAPEAANQSQPLQPAALSPAMVVGAALVDSMNPCGLAVLVFLLISMAAAFDRRRILLVGGAYIVSMFLFHLLVGVGLFSAFSLSGLAKPFSIIGGLIALLFGLITLSDVLRNRETFFLSISESRKGLLGTYARMASVPAAFILGILAGLLGFTCTGGIYISILGLMGRDMMFSTGLPWLILYNIIYVLPLMLVTLLVVYGISPERADRWRNENKRAIRVVIGVILLALGIIILSGWFG